MLCCGCTSPEAHQEEEHTGSGPYTYEHPIPFDPESYVCYRAGQPLLIDGKMDEEVWAGAPWTSEFVDIEGELKPPPPLSTRAKMLWDEKYFYVAARLEEPHIWATLTERDAVIFRDDDFEVFLDPDGDGHNYYEFEINALNTVWDLLLLRPYRVDRRRKVISNWNIKGLLSAVHIEGTLNQSRDEDRYWSVEVAFPWEVLKELAGAASPPENGDQWRVNFSRVDWHMDIADGKYTKQKGPDGKNLPEENWVWSPQGRINMHHPETWGYVQFSDIPAGEGEEDFSAKDQEAIKWGLWQLHFQQVAYQRENGAYAKDLTHFTLPVVELTDYDFKVQLYPYPGGYQFVAPDETGQKEWHIDEEGRIWWTERDRD